MTDYSRQTVIQKPSRFITESPRELFEVWSVEEETLQLEDEKEGHKENPTTLVN